MNALERRIRQIEEAVTANQPEAVVEREPFDYREYQALWRRFEDANPYWWKDESRVFRFGGSICEAVRKTNPDA
jgi:hypothetical protein